MNLTKTDLNLLKEKNISVHDIELQVITFKKGVSFLSIINPATPEKGITVLSEDKIEDLVAYYDLQSKSLSILKFVPASGAATRMFKTLFEFLEDPSKQELVKPLIENLEHFAFHDSLIEKLENKKLSLNEVLEKKEYPKVVEMLLGDEGLNYGELPKALLAFHKHADGYRLAVDEHLVEGAMYARSTDNVVNIHFTVSPEHRTGFEKRIAVTKPRLEKEFGVSFNISFSVQKPSTDTLAVTPDNEPFRDNDGNMVFRPGGHGALLENLNDLDNDLIFIKNIDNVVPDKYKQVTVKYKKALAGKLLELRSGIFDLLKTLESPVAENCDIERAQQFLAENLFVTFPVEFESLTPPDKKKYVFNKLNRPIRVCGMVRNEGEPGGGPFLARNPDGSVSLQIAESSQIDLNNEQQKRLFDKATHFNPVDIVCSVKNYKGEKFDLLKYRDSGTAFISEKSKSGKPLKALELPGLWNGAMSDWNTLFVEVPIETFNPVKTVYDLLREYHQA